jgi:hypothetical protein
MAASCPCPALDLEEKLGALLNPLDSCRPLAWLAGIRWGRGQLKPGAAACLMARQVERLSLLPHLTAAGGCGELGQRIGANAWMTAFGNRRRW